MTDSQSGKTAAVTAYITLIGALIALTMNMEPKNEFARFHIRQAFGIHLLFHGVNLVLSHLFIPWIWYLVYLGGCVFFISGALARKKQLLPGIGEYFQKWFTFIS